MRYVAELTYHNWGPYAGTHVVPLEPTIYAVTAQHESDSDRSNWIGKTWFLNGMLFAFTGLKPPSCRTEDDWITRGAGEGYVQLVTDDGVTIRRERKRTRSTQLTVTLPDGKKLKQSMAQDTVYRMMGLDASDLLATCFIRQKDIARLITTDAATRTGIVAGWVELDPLQRAEAWLRDEFNALVKRLRALAIPESPAGDLSALRTDVTELDLGLAEARGELDQCEEAARASADWQLRNAAVERLTQIRTTGRTLADEVEGLEQADVDAATAEFSAAGAELSAARDREYELRALVNDDWDGQCPLTCSDCTAADEVRAVGASMSIEYGEAELVVNEAAERVDKAKAALATARRTNADRAAKVTRLEAMREEATKLLDDEAWVANHDDPGTDAADRRVELTAEIAELTAELATARAVIAQHEAYEKRVAEVATERDELEAKIRLYGEAVAVVGRNGAQREVAEAALYRIEKGSNELLTQASIDLSVAVQWAREGRGLAAHCDGCGTAFPSSQRVKTCDVCGATRGPKLVEKLDIVPSDRSGAADDIAGLAFQLAASTWLRRKRSASWSSTCIDEPFATLDRANSRALASHLHALIRGNYAFDQGFLVAHDAQAMEALPARIQIYGSDEGAVIEVR